MSSMASWTVVLNWSGWRGEQEQVVYQQRQPVRVLVDDLEKPVERGSVVLCAVEQRLRGALYQRKGRPQLVAHVGHEFLAHPLELAEAGQVVEHQDGPVAGALRVAQRQRVHLEEPGRGHGVYPQLVAEDLKLPVQPRDDRRDLVVPGRLEHRLADGAPLEREQPRGGAVGEADPAGGVHDDEALDHAVEKGGGPLRLLPELDLPAEALLGDVARLPLGLGPA
jgi:hypothetical protein